MSFPRVIRTTLGWRALAWVLAGIAPVVAFADSAPGAAVAVAGQEDAPFISEQPFSAEKAGEDVGVWLERMYRASTSRDYTGTYVMLSTAGDTSTSRVWHVCDNNGQQIERVEALTGSPRTVFRHSDQTVTFFPDMKLARVSRHESCGVFPQLQKTRSGKIADFYTARYLGTSRVAGLEADVVFFAPRDALRFGYRIWSEKQSGLALQQQTLDGRGRVLEQVAFSSLSFEKPWTAAELLQMMDEATGYTVEQVKVSRGSAGEHGWTLSADVPGFQPVDFYVRPAVEGKMMQWLFSDGLATVSLFIEPYDAHRHAMRKADARAMGGATRTLTHRVDDDWWLTVVGEAPFQTLRMFADSLQRIH